VRAEILNDIDQSTLDSVGPVRADQQAKVLGEMNDLGRAGVSREAGLLFLFSSGCPHSVGMN